MVLEMMPKMLHCFKTFNSERKKLKGFILLAFETNENQFKMHSTLVYP